MLIINSDERNKAFQNFESSEPDALQMINCFKALKR